jgi:putative effector of murein hydrolase LrgA (UPF0299 family)
MISGNITGIIINYIAFTIRIIHMGKLQQYLKI